MAGKNRFKVTKLPTSKKEEEKLSWDKLAELNQNMRMGTQELISRITTVIEMMDKELPGDKELRILQVGVINSIEEITTKIGLITKVHSTTTTDGVISFFTGIVDPSEDDGFNTYLNAMTTYADISASLTTLTNTSILSLMTEFQEKLHKKNGDEQAVFLKPLTLSSGEGDSDGTTK